MSPGIAVGRKAAVHLPLTLLAAVIAALFSTAALAGNLRAYFDRDSVYEGDRVTLVVETTSGTLGQPDLSGLGADFDLLGTSQSTNISIVNGKRTDTVRLLISLAPRRTGTIEVPPIPVGDEQTDTLRLTVNELPGAGTGGVGADIFVEMDMGTDPGELVVQQHAGLTVRLFAAVPLIEGSLQDPRADGALVTKLGEDRHYDTKRDGRDYRVIERRYSLSPERSGELRVAPVRFEGRMRVDGGQHRGSGRTLFDDPIFDRFFQNTPLSRDPFNMLDRGKRVSAISRGITLDVKARPGDYKGDHWLPAEDLEIRDSWAESPPELRVGEPITRTLTIEAKGLSGAQIPQIEIPAIPGLRFYPEKADSESRSDGVTVYGISRQGLTLIPTRAGELVIPEIQVSWWDKVAQRERITTLPGWTLKVADGGEAKATAEPATRSPAEPEAHPTPEPLDRKANHAEQENQLPTLDKDPAGSAQRYLTGGVILLVLLLAGAAAWRLRRRDPARPGAAPGRQTGMADPPGLSVQGAKARKALRLACEANDAAEAATALLDWAEATWPGDPPRNLGTLRARVARGGDEIGALERHLYAPGPGSWDGAALGRVFRHELSDSRGRERGQAYALEPLYPRRG